MYSQVPNGACGEQQRFRAPACPKLACMLRRSRPRALRMHGAVRAAHLELDAVARVSHVCTGTACATHACASSTASSASSRAPAGRRSSGNAQLKLDMMSRASCTAARRGAAQVQCLGGAALRPHPTSYPPRAGWRAGGGGRTIAGRRRADGGNGSRAVRPAGIAQACPPAALAPDAARNAAEHTS